MTTRTDLLDIISEALARHLGAEKVTRRADGVLIVAGSSEAFAVQAITIDPPEFANAAEFGEGLVGFIRDNTAPGTDADEAGEPGELEHLKSPVTRDGNSRPKVESQLDEKLD